MPAVVETVVPTSGWVDPVDLAACAGTATSTQVADAAEYAAGLLKILSGNRYGLTAVTVRPFYFEDHHYAGRMPDFGYANWWWSLATLGFADWRNADTYRLEHVAASIESITIDGNTLNPATDYTVLDGQYLLRTPDPGSGFPRAWPASQRLDVAATEHYTWQIRYTYGLEVPVGGQLAAKALACEKLKGIVTGSCSIPENVVSLNRQGVQMTFDPKTFYDNGMTGVDIADEWLKAVNPHGLRKAPSVSFPGSKREWREANV